MSYSIMMQKKRIAWTMLAALASEAVNKVVPLLTMHFAATRLGAEGFGVSQFAMWLIEWAILLVAFGYAQSAPVAIRRAASDLEKRQVAGALVINRLVHSALAFCALYAATRLNQQWGVYRPAVMASAFILFLTAFDMSGILIATQRVGAYSLVTILAKLLSLAGIWLMVRTPQDSAVYVTISNGANGAICAGSLVLAACFSGISAPSLKQMRRIWRMSAPFALSVVVLAMVERFDLYLVESTMGPEGAGWYSGPTKLMQSLVPPIVAISTVFFSEMVRAQDDASLRQHLRLSLLTVMMFVLPLIAGTWFTGGAILGLVFGPGFEQQAATLNILVLNALAHAFILTIGFQTLGLRHRMRPVYLALIAGLACGTIAGPFLVSKFGYEGAALASVASRSIAAIIILVFASRSGLVHLRELSEPMWKAGIPALGMSLVLFTLEMTGDFPIWAAIACGALGYIAFFVLINLGDAVAFSKALRAGLKSPDPQDIRRNS